MRKLTFLLACLFLIGVGLVNAQSRTVSGKVLSAEDGQPVIGASILVKGTTLGTVSDFDGKFSISNIPASAKVLQVSYIGMQAQEVEIKSVLSIVLSSDTQGLDELVVVGYGS